MSTKAFQLSSKFVEEDYKVGEKVTLVIDAYCISIACNMTKAVPPQMLNYCITKTFITGFIQLFMSLLWYYDYSALDAFQPVDVNLTIVRILLCLLLQQSCLSELKKASEILVCLKRMKGSKQNVRGRTINIVIISLQIINNICVCILSIIYFCQEKTFFGMIKGYSALTMILTIDNMFQDIFPLQAKQIVHQLNKQGMLTMSRDHNTTKSVINRFLHNKKDFTMLYQTVVYLIINAWVCLITNFKIVIFTYFAPFGAALL